MNIYWGQAHSARGPFHESPPLWSHENQPPPGPFPPVTLPSRALAAGPIDPSYKWRPRGDGGGEVLGATCRDSPASRSFPKTWRAQGPRD